MSWFYLKALHIIFVITWFSGLFYIVRLFVYHAEAERKPENEKEILQKQYSLMEKRLWYGITWPSAILTFLFGFSLIHVYLPLGDNPWLVAKIFLVFILFLYHLSCGHIYKKFRSGVVGISSQRLRVWNEVPTLLLFSIVFLVVLKDSMSATFGVAGFLGLSILLLLGIRFYKKARKRK